MKIETGVMIMKNGKGWGKTYEDGRSIEYGWMDVEEAKIYDPRFLKRPEDATYKNSPHIEELRKGSIVYVERITQVFVKSNFESGVKHDA